MFLHQWTSFHACLLESVDESHLISDRTDQKRAATALQTVREGCSQQPRLLVLIQKVAPNDNLQMRLRMRPTVASVASAPSALARADVSMLVRLYGVTHSSVGTQSGTSKSRLSR